MYIDINITIEKSGINNITFEAYDQFIKIETAKKNINKKFNIMQNYK